MQQTKTIFKKILNLLNSYVLIVAFVLDLMIMYVFVAMFFDESASSAKTALLIGVVFVAILLYLIKKLALKGNKVFESLPSIFEHKILQKMVIFLVIFAEALLISSFLFAYLDLAREFNGIEFLAFFNVSNFFGVVALLFLPLVLIYYYFSYIHSPANSAKSNRVKKYLLLGVLILLVFLFDSVDYSKIIDYFVDNSGAMGVLTYIVGGSLFTINASFLLRR